VVCTSGATGHSMLFRASEPLTAPRTIRDRTSGAALALLVQASFVLMLLLSRPVTPRHPLAHETILLLHALPNLTSRTIDARGADQRRIAPVQVPLLPNLAPPVLAPPSGIAGFGRSLFGCAPEHYADLPPDEKTHCPKPGEGMAVNHPPDLLNPPKSRAKDEALWQEQWAEDHWVPPVCPPSETPVGFCVMHQAMAENRRAQVARQKIADDKAARLQEPKRPLPNIGVRRN
jgi:hypothetical protein